MYRVRILLFSVLLCLITPSFGARILGIVPVPSYSHQIVFRPLWKELSLRGHQVTVMTTDPMNDPSLTNLTEIDLHFSYEVWSRIDFVNLSQRNLLSLFDEVLQMSTNLIEGQLQNPQVQALIQSEEHFDLVMIEFFFPAMYAFAERFKCPLIGLSSMDTTNSNHAALGNPIHPVLNPDLVLAFSDDLSFFQRLASVFVAIFGPFYFDPMVFHAQQLLVYKYFGSHYPLVYDILKNTSLLFINVSPIFHKIRPLVPAVIPIGGGTHLTSSKPLPKDLQEQLDEASGGFIYFSLGTNVKSKQLPEGARTILLQTFAELPYLVLWKFEQENLPRKPDNVIISRWFPQQDIFKHPNIKLFITQGGLQSMEEAIYNHIPLVGMPFFPDQHTNVAKAVRKGFGLSVDYETLNKEVFKKTILEVIDDPKYRERVKEVAEQTKDQPMSGLQRAIWWTEYVLRHEGAQHLRSPAIDLPLYQYFLLDVMGFCLLVLALVILLIITVVKLLLKLVRLFIGKPKLKVQ